MLNAVHVDEKKRTEAHLIGLFNRTVHMVAAGIRPVYVFDGQQPTLRSGELARLSLRKRETYRDLLEAKDFGRPDGIDKFGSRKVWQTRQHDAECQRLLKLMGIPFVVAPTEAVAQCAALARAGKVYAAATEDLVALAFGSPMLLRHVTFSEPRKALIQEFNLQRILDRLSISREQFVDMCILMGCDYLDPIQNVGPHTALKLIRDHGSLDAAVTAIQNSAEPKYVVPRDWAYAEVRELFLEPDVAPDSETDFKWQKPDVAGIIQYLVAEQNFSEKKVRENAERLEAAFKRGTQSRVDGFFKKTDELKASQKRKQEDQNEGASHKQ